MLATVLKAGLDIALKYTDGEVRVTFEQDELHILINPNTLSEEDASELTRLGFTIKPYYRCLIFYSL